jgi:hypothetical protein
VPPSPAESAGFAKELKQILEPDFVLSAEIKGVRAACAVAVPDLNQVLKGTDGRLFPKASSVSCSQTPDRSGGCCCLECFRNTSDSA